MSWHVKKMNIEIRNAKKNLPLMNHARPILKPGFIVKKPVSVRKLATVDVIQKASEAKANAKNVLVNNCFYMSISSN